MSKKKALIITDGTKTIRSIALPIKDALGGYKVKICPAKRFSGDDLLPVDIFFIGCKRQKPKSFAYLEDFLSHVNLASRKCAVFAISEKALKYLGVILAGSEADVAEPLLVTEDNTGKPVIEEWVNKIL